MRSFTVFKLHFQSPLHVGEPGVGVEKVLTLCIHSDTLWAAFLYGMARLGMDPSPFIPEGEGWAPPMKISSAFPFLGQTHYFPRPLGPWPLEEEVAPTRWKELKKVAFIPQRVFESWIGGQRLSERDADLSLIHI